MGQVSVTLNGRTYRLRCGDGEEERLLSVTAHVGGHVQRLIHEHGQIGDERLILMAAILITDELFELREATASLTSKPDADAQDRLLTPAPAMQPQGSPPTARPTGPSPAAASPIPRNPIPLDMSASMPPRGAVARPDQYMPATVAVPTTTVATVSSAKAPVRAVASAPLEPTPTAAARPEPAHPALATRGAALAQPQAAQPQAAVPPGGPAGKLQPTSARGLDHLDATALMKGIEKKAGRS